MPEIVKSLCASVHIIDILYLAVLVVHSSQVFPLLHILHPHLDLLDFNGEKSAVIISFLQHQAIRRITHYAIKYSLGQENIQYISFVIYGLVSFPLQVFVKVITATYSTTYHFTKQFILNTFILIVVVSFC